MLSIAEQIQGLRQSTPLPQAIKQPNRHKLLNREIDDLCCSSVVANPGSGIDEVHAEVEHYGLTHDAVQVSLARLVKANRLIFVQRCKKEKARYWPDSMHAEADAFRNSFVPGGQEERIYNAMAPGVIYTTNEISAALCESNENIMKAIRRLESRGCIEQKGKSGLVMRWVRKAAQAVQELAA